MVLETVTALIAVKEKELALLRSMLDECNDNNFHVQLNLVSEISSATVELNRLVNLKVSIQKGEK